MAQHEYFMQMALNAAEDMSGQTWPNPFVGALLVREGQVIAKAATAKSGRPHAETQVLEQAGAAAKGATLYITLEPCAHEGQTPPCVDAIIHAGIAEVVVACSDQDERTKGIGLQTLRDAGLKVTAGICEEQARFMHRGFFSRVARGRPWVTLKMAASMDGKVALATGESKWITGEKARQYGHVLRAQNDAILSTSRSIANDDARLTCRLPGLEHRSPVRVVLDRNLRLEQEGRVFVEGGSPVWVITHQQAEDAAKFDSHVEICTLASSKDWLPDLFNFLGERGITRVLVETGGTFASALLGADLVDELAWFTAPMIIGDDGIPSVKALNMQSLPDARLWKRIESRMLGEDRLDVLVKQRAETT